MSRILASLAVAGLVMASAGSAQAITPDEVVVKKAIADRMTPEQLQAYKERTAANVNAAASRKIAPGVSRTPSDTCTAATNEIGTLPYNPAADTTVGATDDYKIPGDTTAPTCTAASNCVGGASTNSGPRGAIYTGTGVGPDRAYRLRTSANCTLTITADPTSTTDMGLILYETQCSNSSADCACVDDTGVGGVAESVALDAIAGTTYFAVIDGYSTSAVPPGPSGPFTLAITGSGCTLVPVTLESFTVS